MKLLYLKGKSGSYWIGVISASKQLGIGQLSYETKIIYRSRFSIRLADRDSKSNIIGN
jgi:hypothetical protein